MIKGRGLNLFLAFETISCNLGLTAISQVSLSYALHPPQGPIEGQGAQNPHAVCALALGLELPSADPDLEGDLTMPGRQQL